MSSTKTVLSVSDQTTLSEILTAFQGSEDDLVLLDVNTVISGPHLELLTDYPRSISTAFVAKSDQPDITVRGGKVASASSSYHQVNVPNRAFVGALRLSQKQREGIIASLTDAISANLPGNALELCLVALVRALVDVEALELKGAPYGRSSDASEREKAKKELSKVSDERIRLRLANRANDGFYSVYFVRRISKILTWIAVKIGATPNQVTVVSFTIGLLAAYLFSFGDLIWNIVAALLLQVSLTVDCVDGELARYTRRFSAFGAWLDAITDRVKEYMVFLGLAVGSLAAGGVDVWALAMTMMAIQTFRHLSDYNFGQVVRARAQEIVRTPTDYLAKEDGLVPIATGSGSTLKYWLGRIVLFPIGERWLVISLSAAIGGGQLTFLVMPALALISILWVLKVRIVRSLAMPKERIKSPVIARQLDLFAIKKPLSMRFDWAEPSLLRLIELGVLITFFAISNSLGIASFLILFAIAFHHYDNLYRAMQNEEKPSWLKFAGLTISGRVVLLGFAAFGGWPLEFYAFYYVSLFVFVSSIQWVIAHRKKS